MIAHRLEGRRVWPIMARGMYRVLDIGCGNGDALERAGIEGLAVGIDIGFDELRAGAKLLPRCRFCQAVGEALPFKDQSFDAALSRVALPYMDIPKTLEEAARVLRPGGEVWFVLHPFSFVVSRLAEELRKMNLKGIIYACYIILNGLSLHFVGRNFRFPLNRSQCESFQTLEGIRRVLARAGFERITVTEYRPFVVTARRVTD